MSETPKQDSTWKDWKRTIVSTATIVLAFSVYYHGDREAIQTHIVQLESNFNAHCQSARNYNLAELDERFVSRREWDGLRGEISALKDEIRYFRTRIDAIYDKVNTTSK